jgi:hypothetical protein
MEHLVVRAATTTAVSEEEDDDRVVTSGSFDVGTLLVCQPDPRGVLGGTHADVVRLLVRAGDKNLLVSSGVDFTRVTWGDEVPAQGDQTRPVATHSGLMWSHGGNETPATLSADYSGAHFGRLEGIVERLSCGDFSVGDGDQDLLALATRALDSLESRKDEDLEEWAAALIGDVTKI